MVGMYVELNMHFLHFLLMEYHIIETKTDEIFASY